MTIRKIGETAVCSPLKRASLLALAVVFFISVTAFAVPPVMYNVNIRDGSSVEVYSTAQTDAALILEEAGYTLNEAYGDSVDLSAFTAEDGSTIVINRGVKVRIENFDGSSHTVYASGTVKDAIEKAGLTVSPENALSVKADEKLTSGMVIEIYGVYNITVKCDGKTVTAKISAATVKEAVKLCGVKLGVYDYSVPALSTEIEGDMSIEVFRVAVKERKAEEAIPYETTYTYTDELFKDHTHTLVDGVEGKKSVLYKDMIVEGELVTSEVISEEVISEPTPAVVEVGTKVNPYPSQVPVGTPISELNVPSYVNIGANGVPTNYSKVINAKATAYCIPGGITSTGRVAQAGYIAVDPNEIPYGTEMYIVSADGRYIYGYCIAADTGGFIYDVDWTVDLFMNSDAQCVNWGRRDIIIYVL